MSKKYVITNCPAILRMTKVCDDYRTTRDNPQLCKDCTDCVMKQIVELCKENLNSLETYVDVRSLECTILQSILKLLDIQEIE